MELIKYMFSMYEKEDGIVHLRIYRDFGLEEGTLIYFYEYDPEDNYVSEDLEFLVAGSNVQEWERNQKDTMPQFLEGKLIVSGSYDPERGEGNYRVFVERMSESTMIKLHKFIGNSDE